jgi:hypothetical protein
MLLSAFWGIVQSWIDDFIKQKMTICGYKNVTETLLEYIDEDTLEQKYGGNKPDISEQFFPPKM